jgi:hypothetical protein
LQLIIKKILFKKFSVIQQSAPEPFLALRGTGHPSHENRDDRDPPPVLHAYYAFISDLDVWLD